MRRGVSLYYEDIALWLQDQGNWAETKQEAPFLLAERCSADCSVGKNVIVLLRYIFCMLQYQHSGQNVLTDVIVA